MLLGVFMNMWWVQHEALISLHLCLCDIATQSWITFDLIVTHPADWLQHMAELKNAFFFRLDSGSDWTNIWLHFFLKTVIRPCMQQSWRGKLYIYVYLMLKLREAHASPDSIFRWLLLILPHIMTSIECWLACFQVQKAHYQM